MSPLAETILFVFGLVAFGYLAGLTGYLSERAGEVLTEFAVRVALPLLLFRTMVGADFGGADPGRLWAAYFAAVIVTWISGHLVITRGFGRDAAAGVIGGVSSAFSNIVLLGIPFVLGVFGQEGFAILSLIISVHLPVMMVASTVLFQLFGRDQTVPLRAADLLRPFVRRLASNPLIIGIVAGLIVRATGHELPSLAIRFVDALAGIAGPLALFGMGLSLRRFSVSGNVGAALSVAMLKLLLMPAVALVAAWLLDMPPLAAKVTVAAAALPSGVNSYLIAAQFGTGQALASTSMTIATAAAIVTTAVWLSLATIVFG